jgi:hypothetical protein
MFNFFKMIAMPGITFNVIQVRFYQERANATNRPILSREAPTFPQSPVHVYTERISIRDGDNGPSKPMEV